ncbi:ABC transporter permease [Actinoallomurus vinaceus]|uniref:ABC transporter permease n=1 Tax=Actinoallomurus vinaceus TaxID=1080074 RepID=A0ABP8U7Q1_9ACTN
MASPRSSGRRSAAQRIGSYGLLALGVVLFAVFAVALPETFPTMATITSLLSSHAIPAVLALGATIPIVAGRFDLSIGYGLGLWHVLILQLMIVDGWPWQAACVAALAGGTLIGAINGLLVEFAQIDSFIATLGTGSIMYAISGWTTHGGRILPGPSGLPPAFTGLYETTFLGVPVPTFYVLLLAAVLWLVLEHLPLGRYLYVIGDNPRAAELVGIPTRRYIVYAFAASGVISAGAGVLLAAQQEIGDPSIGLDYLVPAFVAALLGSTAIRLGRPNALGTLVAVAVLAIGLAGIGQFGAEFWVTPLFNGVTLLIAVGLAGYSARRRERAHVRPRAAPARPAGERGEAAPSATPDGTASPAPPSGEGSAREPRA